MSCSPFDLKDFLLEELNEAECRQQEAHIAGCRACREELERLRLTQTALRSLREEEPPRRIAFVSDRVLQPRWWEAWWQSAPRLGFASAALLSCAILAHAFLRPPPSPPPAAPDPAVIEARVTAEVARRLEPAVAKAVADSEQRQAKKMTQLVADAAKRLDFDRRADRVAFEETLKYLQKKMNVRYMASADVGGLR